MMTNQYLEFSRAFNTIVIVMLFVMLVVVVVASIYLLVRMKRKVDGLLETIESLSGELKRKSDTAESSDGGEALQSLLTRIDSIYGYYYRHGETEVSKKHLVGQVQDTLDYLRSSELLENLERSINKETGNLLKNFYEHLGSVQEKRRRLLVFTYYNLSVETICLVLEITPNALYKRRGRLREVIETSGFIRSEELLNHLFPEK